MSDGEIANHMIMARTKAQKTVSFGNQITKEESSGKISIQL